MNTPTSIRFDSSEKPYSEQMSHATTGDCTLMLSIKNVPVIQGMLVVEVDKLTPNDY